MNECSFIFIPSREHLCDTSIGVGKLAETNRLKTSVRGVTDPEDRVVVICHRQSAADHDGWVKRIPIKWQNHGFKSEIPTDEQIGDLRCPRIFDSLDSGFLRVYTVMCQLYSISMGLLESEIAPVEIRTVVPIYHFPPNQKR